MWNRERVKLVSAFRKAQNQFLFSPFSFLPVFVEIAMICPICGKPVQWQDNPSRPFCSERCKMIDLGNWVDEEYRVPADPASPEDFIGEDGPQQTKDEDTGE